MEYKIEKKPHLYEITRSAGSYSDYECDFEVVAANSPEEAWLFITAFWKDLYDKDPKETEVQAVKWGDKYINFDNTFTPKWVGHQPFTVWNCEIEMLSVIHVASL